MEAGIARERHGCMHLWEEGMWWLEVEVECPYASIFIALDWLYQHQVLHSAISLILSVLMLKNSSVFITPSPVCGLRSRVKDVILRYIPPVAE